MTRSKEFRRIEAAIKHKDATELRWAETECKLRLSFSQREQGVGAGVRQVGFGLAAPRRTWSTLAASTNPIALKVSSS